MSVLTSAPPPRPLPPIRVRKHRRWLPRVHLNRSGFRLTVYGRDYNHSVYAVFGYQRARRNQR